MTIPVSLYSASLGALPRAAPPCRGPPDTDPRNLFHGEVRFVHRVANAAFDAAHDSFDAALGFGTDFCGADAVVGIVENAGEDFGAAQINSDDVFCFGIRHGGDR